MKRQRPDWELEKEERKKKDKERRKREKLYLEKKAIEKFNRINDPSYILLGKNYKKEYFTYN